MGHSIFVTGTDTGVGKTFFSAGIVRMLREVGVDAVGFKPIECGGRCDSADLLKASGDQHTLDEINPVWFHQPVAPLVAADSPDDLAKDRIVEAHQKLVDRHELVVVEGAGGWFVPLQPGKTMADLAVELCDEVIIVAANRLGVLNHSLLTYKAVKDRGIDCARLILNFLPVVSVDSIESVSMAGMVDFSLASNEDSLRKCLPDVGVFPLKNEGCFAQLIQDVFRTETT